MLLKNLFFYLRGTNCMGTARFTLFDQREAVLYGVLSETIRRCHQDSLKKIAEFIRKKVSIQPEVLIICGSGLGGVCEKFKDPVSLNYKDIPNFPVSTIEGHKGRLVFGLLSNTKVVCMQGRFHFYEGYSLQQCTIPIRALSLVGVKVLIVTNAAGGVNSTYKAGDVMLIKDQINFLGLAGMHPLRGPNDPKFGPRFFPMNKAYDKVFIEKAKELLCELGLGDNTHEGVYAMVGGPNFETVAEIKMLRRVGADAVGMSTVPEVLVAKHCGMHIFGFSIISNVGIDSYDDQKEPNHKEVLETMNKRTETLTKFVTDMAGHVVQLIGGGGKC